MTKKEWEKVYMGYANDTQDSLAKQARQYFFEIFKEFSKFAKDENQAFLFSVNLFASYIDADKVIAPSEWALFNYIFNMDKDDNYKEIEAIVNDFRKMTSYDELDKIIEQCESDLKNTIIRFGLCVCAIDERITIPEQDIIEKYAD
ncbi:MAG: hypothetical protein J6T15_00710 [Bacilli bacterium]|nr:hypothetical protein [Bacilli bacterium]